MQKKIILTLILIGVLTVIRADFSFEEYNRDKNSSEVNKTATKKDINDTNQTKK